MGAIRRGISYANVVATLALLFAMSGGVMAATGKFASSGKLRACVGEGGRLSLLKAGKHCKQDQSVVAWNQIGPQGPKGAAGSSGSAGASGTPGAAGSNGATGFTSTLPSGKTEVGTWGGDLNTEEIPYYMPISFTIPLAEEPETTIVAKGSEPTEECPGTPGEPQAASGQLCIYVGELFQGTLFTFDPSKELGGANGTMLGLKPTSKSAIAYGTWAVTG